VGQVALLDVTRADDRHTSERLSADPIIWLGTVRREGVRTTSRSGSRGMTR
jgi:hypothetical protein